MSNDRQTTIPSTNGTNITHNVNLSFEIGTCNVSTGSTHTKQNVNLNNGEGNCAPNEEINGKPQGISHGNNHEMHLGYSGNVTRNLGNPSRIRPENDNIARIQEETLGDEAIKRHVNSTGKPEGISHETQTPTIVDPTHGNQIHDDVKLHTDMKYINFAKKLFLLLQELYPPSKIDYDVINKYEKIAISIVKTAIVPIQHYHKDEINAFYGAIRIINAY